MQSGEPVSVHKLMQACYTAFAACGLFSFFVNLLMLTMPLFMFQVFDRVLASRSESTLLLLLLMGTVALGVQAALDSVRSLAFVRISGWIDRRIAPLMLSTLVVNALDRSKTATTNPLRSLATLRGFLTGPGMLTVLDLPWVPVFLLLIFYLNTPMGMAALAGAILMLVLGIMNDRLTRPALAEAQTHSGKAYQAADAAVRNAAVVESMGMRRQVLRRYQTENEKVLQLQSKASDRAAMFLAISKSSRMLVQMVIMSVAAVQIIDPTTPLTPGMMIATVLILGRALQPIEMGVGQARNMIEAMEAYRIVEESLKTAQGEVQRMSLPAPSGAMSVENVYYQPPSLSKPILQRITFDVKAGESIGVIGPSAAGKSTLARLLVGVEKANLGHVRLDGADIFTWNAEELGAFIGFMPQDIELFGGTVAQNIGRLEDEPDAEKVVHAAKLAGLHEMILRLPDGYDTEIGWAGQILSGGQRQRIALARALYGDPKVVILDEPNANLDSQGDEALNNAIRHIKRMGNTLILITHRPQTLALVDKVLILQNGMVQRFGPREEMVSFLNDRRRGEQAQINQQGGALPGGSSVGEGAAASASAAAATSSEFEAEMPRGTDAPIPDGPMAGDQGAGDQGAVGSEPLEAEVGSEFGGDLVGGADEAVDDSGDASGEDATDNSADDQAETPRRRFGRGAVVRPPGPFKAKAKSLNVQSVRAISAKDDDS